MQQHRAAKALAEVINLSEESDPALADRLYAMEEQLDHACAPLRSAAYRRLQGLEIDRELEWAVLQALDECAAYTAQVEHILWEVSPEIASFFLPLPVAISASGN